MQCLKNPFRQSFIPRWSFDKGVRGDGGTGGQNPTIGATVLRDFCSDFKTSTVCSGHGKGGVPCRTGDIKIRLNSILSKLCEISPNCSGGNDANQEE